MNFYYALIFIIAVSLILSGYRMARYIISAKKLHITDLYLLIETWFRLVSEKGDVNLIAETEKAVDALFEKKVLKTSLLHFDDKFIKKYLPEASTEEFEKTARTDLTKSKQSLKIVSLAFGHKFTLSNYPFYNYWLILKGNYNLCSQNRADAQGRQYTFSDVEEPFRVLEYYFADKAV